MCYRGWQYVVLGTPLKSIMLLELKAGLVVVSIALAEGDPT